MCLVGPGTPVPRVGPGPGAGRLEGWDETAPETAKRNGSATTSSAKVGWRFWDQSQGQGQDQDQGQGHLLLDAVKRERKRFLGVY